MGFDIVRPSPTVASMEKFTSIPVSKYNGIPEINIPLWNVETKNIKLPISINYHASGLKVDEISSWIGRGWSLNAGGVISRIIRDKDDFNKTPGFSYINSVLVPLLTNINWNCFGSNVPPDPGNAWDYLGYALGDKDLESQRDLLPDLFSFSFNGYSGQFLFRNDGSIQLIPKQDLKITAPNLNNPAIYSDYFIIITPDGYEYTFGDPSGNLQYQDRVTTQTVVEATPDCWGNNRCSSSYSHNQVMAWHLSQIKSPEGDVLNFEYQKNTISSNYYVSETDLCDAWGNYSECYPCIKEYWKVYQSRTFEQSFPTYIKYDGKNLVLFEVSNDRCDIPNGIRLKKITVHNVQEEPQRVFTFHQNFFINEPDLLYQPCSVNITEEESRNYTLWLHRLTESVPNGESKPPYKFIYYHQNSMPPRYSNAQDFWGFANGKLENDNNPNYFGQPTRIPEVLTNNGVYYSGADRDPDFECSLEGTLTKVIYPTKGYSEYEFEPNIYKISPPEYQMVNHPELQFQYDMNSIGIEQSFMFQVTTVQPTIMRLQYKAVGPNNNNNNCDDSRIYVRLRKKIGNSYSNPLNTYSITAHRVNGQPDCLPPDFTGAFYSEIIDEITEGEYKAELFVHTDANPPDEIPEMIINWPEFTSTLVKEKEGGGIRIRTIRQFDALDHKNDMIRKFEYTKTDEYNNIITSGKLMSELEPIHFEVHSKKECIVPCLVCYPLSQCLEVTVCSHTRRTNGSLTGLTAEANGAFVGYDKVTEIISGAKNGKTEYFFTNIPVTPQVLVNSMYGEVYNPAPPITNSYNNGLLLKQIEYKGIGNSVILTGDKYYMLLGNNDISFNEGLSPYQNYILSFWSDYPISVISNELVIEPLPDGLTDANGFTQRNYRVRWNSTQPFSLALHGVGYKIDELFLTPEEYPDPPYYAYTGFESSDHGGWLYSDNTIMDYPVTFEMVRKVENTYQNVYEFSLDLTSGVVLSGILYGWNDRNDPFVCKFLFDIDCPYSCDLTMNFYNQKSEWIRLLSTIEQFYDESGNPTQSITKTFTYDFTNPPRHFNPVKIQENTSEGELLTTHFKYSADFGYNDPTSGDEALKAIALLANSHNNKLIEKMTTKGTYPNWKYISADLFTYKDFGSSGNHLVKPWQVYKAEFSQPSLTFTPSNFSGMTSGYFTFSSDYQLEYTVDQYNSSGNLIQYHRDVGNATNPLGFDATSYI
jgi:hypothetical protein